VSVVVVPVQGDEPARPVLRAILHRLNEARLITTRVHVVAPVYLDFGVCVTLVKQRQVSSESVKNGAMKRLGNFFDRLRGGSHGKGWPFGRNIYVSELYDLLAQVPGVEYVTRSVNVEGDDREELVVEPANKSRRCLNDAEELESIEVYDQELVSFQSHLSQIEVREETSRP
jgi:hypothetical protein